MEPIDRARSRFADANPDLIGRRAPGNLIVVAHGTAIGAFAAPEASATPAAFWRPLGLLSFVTLSLPDLAALAVVAVTEDGS